VPASAVATSDLPQVLMVDDGTITYRKIQIGRRLEGQVEVINGLEESEEVIVDVSGLTRGLPVKIVASS
jgi:multidrug efflux pump subunit AcrA (membrane-fusion protein)